jgi:hypothetical protein
MGGRGKDERDKMDPDELLNNILAADQEQQQASQAANSDEARWTPPES